MKLSIGMIVKNESKYLRQCLTALNPIIDNIESELIIVDTGSTDNTVEIAKEFTDKILFHQWNDDFAEARNITIDKSKGEWYFYIDADEILENPKSIIEFFNTGTYKKYEAMSINIKNLISEDKYDQGDVFHSIRLSKRDNQLRFYSRIHEQLPQKEPVYLSETSIIHYGYIHTNKKLIARKVKRNCELLKKELQNDPNNVYLLFHLAKTYSANENYIGALEEIEKAYNIVENTKDTPMWVYNYMIEICIKNNLFLKAERVAIGILERQTQETTASISTYFYLAQTQAVLGKNPEAIESYKQCLRLMELYRDKKLKVDFSESIKYFQDDRHVYLQLAFLYDNLLDFYNASMYIEKILKSYNGFKDIELEDYFKSALRHMVKLCLKYKKYDNLIEVYKNIIDHGILYYNETQEKQVLEIEYKLQYNFIVTLESIIVDTIDVRQEIIERFSKLDIDNDYVFLNRLRNKKEGDEKLSEEDIYQILQINFTDNIDIYAEFIYFLMSDGINVEDIMTKLYEKQINNYIEYMSARFKNFSTVVNNYFKKYDDKQDLAYCIFSKAFKRAVLIKEGIDKKSYFKLFNRYIKEGIFYMEEVYRDNILDMENTYVVKNNEEAFFMFMRKSNSCNTNEQAIYVQYLRKALYSYDYMNKGIEMLLEKVDESEDNGNENIKNEFEEYKDMIKKNITILLEANKIGEAKHLIDEYFNIVPDDLEMLMLKSEIQLKMM